MGDTDDLPICKLSVIDPDRYEDDDRFALVAVEPNPHDREGIDRAFGELLRFRRGFNDVTPGATMDAIDLVVAGPTFPEIYEWVVRDADVRLVTVDTS